MISRLSFAPQFRGPAFGVRDVSISRFPDGEVDPLRDAFAHDRIVSIDNNTKAIHPYKGQKSNPFLDIDDEHLLDKDLLPKHHGSSKIHIA